MESIRIFLSFIIIYIFSGVFSVIHADNHAGAVTFSLEDGFYIFSHKRHVENTTLLNASLGYNFTNNWGIEALAGFLTTPSLNSEDNGQQVNGNLYLINGLYRFKPYKNILQPFISAGVGVLDLNPNGSDPHAMGNINAGAGAQLFIHPSIAFRFDVRDLYTINGGYNDVFFNAGMSFLMF